MHINNQDWSCGLVRETIDKERDVVPKSVHQIMHDIPCFPRPECVVGVDRVARSVYCRRACRCHSIAANRISAGDDSTSDCSRVCWTRPTSPTTITKSWLGSFNPYWLHLTHSTNFNPQVATEHFVFVLDWLSISISFC